MRIRIWILAAVLLVVVAISGVRLYGQDMKADAKFGLSILSGNGSSTGILFGGGLDIPIDKSLYARPELNITTHPGTPINIAGEIKYFLPGQEHPEMYIDGGLGFWFYSGGSALGIDFGAGALFPLSNSKLVIPAEIRLGPIFESGSSVFQIALTSGVRFSLK